MQGWFVIAIVLAVLTLASAVVWRVLKVASDKAGGEKATTYENATAEDARPWLKGTTIVLGALTALFVLVSSATPVSTQNVGIETSFGRPVGHLSNGLHFIPPWEAVTEMDGSIQTTSYLGPRSCLQVRIGGQQTACAWVSIQWRIQPGAADALFRNYHDFATVQTALVNRELESAVNTQMSGYSPIQDLATGVSSKARWIGFAAAIAAQMRREIGSQISVVKVILPYVTYDAATQTRINELQQQIAATLIAQQAEKTAAAQGAANQALAATVSHDPGVLTANCLNLLSAAIKANYQLPAGFSCFGGSSVGVVASTGGK